MTDPCPNLHFRFYNGTRELHFHHHGNEREERDVSYWRRRGQDFSLLLDYADGRELRAGGGVARTEGAWRAPPPEERRADRQHWDESAWLRVRDAAQGQWRTAAVGDRKCQSLGTEEWRPAVGLGRHLSDGEGEGVLSPESLQYTDAPASLQDGHRLNGSASQVPHGKHHNHHHNYHHHNSNVAGSREPWTGRYVALLPKPRFSRPLKPPSYETHQQTRGSVEMLAGDQVPKAKDRVAGSIGGPPGRDYFAHEAAESGAEPPGYIPPPSYKRPLLLHRVGQRNNGEALSYRFQEVEQVPGSTEVGRWYSRQPESSWLECQRDRSAPPCRKPAFPGRSEEERLGSVQYLPFDDPRVRHISGGPCGNSLTDSDKIRSINKEVPSANGLGQSTHDSAFLPPQELFLNTDASKTSLSEQDGGNRWHCGLHKGSDNSIASNKSSEQPTDFQVRQTQQNRNQRQGFPETVTQVKKIEPSDEVVEKNKTTKRKLNETIFCLVSVPIHLQANAESLCRADCNKPTDSVEDSSENVMGHFQNQSLLSTSSTDLELQALIGGITCRKGPKKPPPGKEVGEARSLQSTHDLSSGSWPGNQYRDQETQTISPEASRGPPQGLADQQAQDQARSDTTTDSGVGTDCSNRYGYPMTGQKNLNPSSNSAFSRTSNYSGQLHKSTAPSSPPPPPPLQPSGNQEETDYLPTQKGLGQSKPLAGLVQEAFGQFLLKPVSRRPWDAIEELESFNKELQQQIVKGASVDQCIEDLDEAYRDILELGTVSNNREGNSIEKMRIPDCKADPSLLDEPLSRTSKARHTLESWTAAADPAYREVKSAFSRPGGKTVSFSLSKQLREEGLASSETGFREYSAIMSQISDKPMEGGCDCRAAGNPDRFTPKESRHRGLAGSPEHIPAEVPWASRPMQDASTLTSPPDYEDVYHALQLSRETAGVNRGVTAQLGSAAASPQTSFFKAVAFTAGSQLEGISSKVEPLRQVKEENSVPRFRGEKSLNVLMIKSQRDRFRGQGPSRCIVGNDPTEDINAERMAGTACSSSSCDSEDDNVDSYSWRTQLSFAEMHLETLLIDEKVNSTPEQPLRCAEAEDLSNLYEVKCAKGIPENESIEERAARILGIDVPVESLGMMEQKGVGGQSSEEKDTMEGKPLPLRLMKISSGERILRVSWQREETDIDSFGGQEGQEMDGVMEARVGVGGRGGFCGEVVAPDRNGLGNHLGSAAGFPEFPAERLKLSVALNGEGKLGLSSGGVRRVGQGPSRAIEALRDRLATPHAE
ncbi:hypothetical protein AAFF_G00021810 [Aldrovandia affinis]|uniref:Junctional protein associated with coronary artery disease n=1 Tax=Aldrovandia affinis TaxID=143900 RepID=A0AAD7S5B9_9TELE|nr:hypothetical protein AAFF_G00021810 [Aldrovandia affinis]